MDLYSHALPSLQREAMNTLQRLFLMEHQEAMQGQRSFAVTIAVKTRDLFWKDAFLNEELLAFREKVV